MALQQTFFFYDLETSGLDPKRHRIMQFAGQRTDLDLNPIGDPIDIKVALNDDVLPDPQAILVTGITPQQTQEEGYSEADFCKMVHAEVCTEGTIMVGFNSIRFDDEFMRYTFYRNFYDPYEWCWSDRRSRWDLLDVVRITRALRPDGIEWPVDDNGKATNRLELITRANGIDHLKAHDALSDVEALIAVAKLIKEKQPKLFDYMLSMREKNKIKELVNLDEPQPFIYVSGRYDNDHHKTTIAYPIAEAARPGSVVVYDLRFDPSVYLGKTAKELSGALFASWAERQAEGFIPVPVKELAYNKCPAVAPIGIAADEMTQQRLSISLDDIQERIKLLQKNPAFAKTVADAFKLKPEYSQSDDCDSQLYNGFLGGNDKAKMAAVRAANRNELTDFRPDFADKRLDALLTRYKARNYPQSLSSAEREEWEVYRAKRIEAEMPQFLDALKKIASSTDANEKQFLLEELQLWAQAIAPTD